MSLCQLLGIDVPIVQAPMAGVSTPKMAAEVANAGALGSIAVGAATVAEARQALVDFRALSSRSLNVNVFCHRPAKADPAREAAWCVRLPFAELGAPAPAALRDIYTSFVVDDAMHALLLEAKPRVVSFHFGLPAATRIASLRAAGIVLLATATNLAEARTAALAGVHAVVAQGWEAGGHRGIFDPEAPDDRLGTLALVQVLARALPVPVIAAGGIMDGAGIAAVLRLGAGAAQLGTAFIACPESIADAAFRQALASEAAHHTTVTRAVSGRPARGLANRFTALEARDSEIPDYPIAYDAGKSLHAAAKARGEFGYGAQWAGQGAPLARSLPAADLVRTLVREMGSQPSTTSS